MNTLMALGLVLRVFDRSGDSAESRQAAMLAADSILREADVTATWVDCSKGSQLASHAACTDPLGSGELAIRITEGPREKAPTSQRALGYSLVEPAVGGTLATIFSDRVAWLAASSASRYTALLGRAVAHEIGDWSPQFLDVSPVHGAWFALYCERHNIKFPSLRFVLCSYEFVSIVHRRIIERAFGVPVFILYGATETGHLLMENERGAMKPSRETAYLEVVNPDGTGVGELVVTTLSNDYMPLLRYRIGDLAEHHLNPYEDIYVVHGRARDALTAGDGKRITTCQVDHCFAGAENIAHYELRQTAPAQFVLRLVPAQSGPEAATLDELRARLGDLLRPASAIETLSLPTLLPAASGKFRLTCTSA